MLFPFRHPTSYALYLHHLQKPLNSHALVKFKPECVMQHRLNCGSACQTGDCHNLALRIVNDLQFNTKDGHFPPMPLHPETVKDVDVIHLTSDEVVEFFKRQDNVAGLLIVEEFCARKKSNSHPIKPWSYVWDHIYVIERHGSSCYLMQSDVKRFHVGHFMRQGQAFPGSQGLRDVERVKNKYGYNQALPEGMRCDRLYDVYKKTYRIDTAIEAYQRKCLVYFRWKLSLVPNVTEEVDINRLALDLQEESLRLERDVVLEKIRRSSMSWAHICGDPNPICLVWNPQLQQYRRSPRNDCMRCPGSVLDPEYLPREIKKQKGGPSWMTGRKGKCVPIASVPAIIEAEGSAFEGLQISSQ